MSALRRLFHTPASTRSYSSFFSSKSGGGRYFNPSKPTKTGVVAPKNATNSDPSSEVQKDGVQATSTTPSTTVGPSPLADSPSPPTTVSSSATSRPDSLNSVTPSSTLTEVFPELTQHQAPRIAISSKDFRTHQFFSLHRPLLLISQPPSIFRPIPPNFSIFSTVPPALEGSGLGKHGAFDEGTGLGAGFGFGEESSADANAEAARQLARALTMNRAGATVAWEDTLRHLGLDVSKDADRVGLQAQFEKEWDDVLMDSTKRKRRKKMKKHKLKKRRRATRSERMRLK